MDAGGICPERDRLLELVTKLSNRYAEASLRLASIAGQNDREAFQFCMKQAKELRSALQTARSEYESHLNQHGCKRG